jgi:non-specific protein-tyrosine kinase
MAAAGLVLLMDSLDTTVTTAEQAAMLTGLPVLAAIAQARRGAAVPALAVVEAPGGAQAEAFRTLRTGLEFAPGEQPLRTLLVTSPEDEAGKTTVAANLAAAFAQAGGQVLLVDADVRRPRLHALLGLGNERGLGDVLPAGAGYRAGASLQAGAGFKAGLGYKAGATYRPVPPNATFDASLAQTVPGLPNLRLLPSGRLPAQPYELLGGERTATLLSAMQEAAGIVVLDSPPLIVADPARLAAQVDGVLLVVRLGRTKAEALLAAVDQLERAGARVLGLVLNGVPRGTAFYPRTYVRNPRLEPPLAGEQTPALGDVEVDTSDLGEVGADGAASHS